MHEAYACVHVCMYIHVCALYTYIYTYNKTSLNRPNMEPTLNSPFREVVSLASENMLTMDRLGPN